MYENGVKTVSKEQDSQKFIFQVSLLKNILCYNKELTKKTEDLGCRK